MPRGGKRPGAGRKKGSATRKTRAVADAVAAGGEISPLEVMIDAMRRLHRAKKYGKAAAIAAQAAPYCHPRLSAVTLKGDPENPIRLVEELVIADGSADPPAPGTPGPA